MNRALAALAAEFPLINDLFTTRLKQSLAALAILFAVIASGAYAEIILDSEDLFTRAGPIIGGDFVMFNLAAQLAGTPDMASLYDLDFLKETLKAAHPGKGEFNLPWLYPPTISLLIQPFAEAPYLASFTFWVLAFGGIYLTAVWRFWPDKWAFVFILAAPATFQAVITGQNGFLTAALIALAGAFADRRPLIAGLAAGLLTIKPQLGLLIPIAFLAAGCWRAFLIAAVSAILFALLSLVAFGHQPWVEFAAAIATHTERMSGFGFPFYKLVTPFGFATMLGAPIGLANAVQIAASLALAAYIFVVWRRIKDWDLRVAALSTAAMLATPYAMYYELVIMAPAMLLIARRGAVSGWLPLERTSLIAVWAAPILMPGSSDAAAPLCASAAFVAFLVAARRTLAAAGVRFAIEETPAQAGS
ncbi:MAG: DUF2029 domain-containing protein [Parvularculaceae bacterium]|nr:DUF2029 domain-containing protein [Parvularculaceae bacterium]